MNNNRTQSILQHVPKILAVTAASYGLSPQAAASRETRSCVVRSHASRMAERAGREAHAAMPA